jgi:hypothetical protein
MGEEVLSREHIIKRPRILEVWRILETNLRNEN